MAINKIALSVYTIFAFTLFGNAFERIIPLSLEELQNPNGPSYVPIPYPKTNEEIIVNLKYYMNARVTRNKSTYFKGDKVAYDDLQKICLNFLENRGIRVGEIVTVKNEIASRERDYAFLIRLINENNYGVANIGMDANGLVLTGGYISLKSLSEENPNLKEMIFKPVLDKIEFKQQLKKLLGYELNEEEEMSITIVEGISLVGELIYPAIKIKLKNGRTLFKSMRLNKIFEVMETLNTADPTFREKAASIMRTSNYSYQVFDQSASNEKLFLREALKEYETLETH